INSNQAQFPSLHHRKEAWLRHQENFAQPPKLTQPGWFSFCSHRKTTPAARSAEASQSFFDRSATPPCGDARRGIALFQFFHSSIDRRHSGFLPSKNELQRQLDDAIVACRQSVVPTDIVGDLPKVWRSEGNSTTSLSCVGRGTRSKGIQMVGKVEGFGAQLNRLVFSDRKGP